MCGWVQKRERERNRSSLNGHITKNKDRDTEQLNHEIKTGTPGDFQSTDSGQDLSEGQF
jgi:hypothetical protein